MTRTSGTPGSKTGTGARIGIAIGAGVGVAVGAARDPNHPPSTKDDS